MPLAFESQGYAVQLAQIELGPSINKVKVSLGRRCYQTLRDHPAFEPHRRLTEIAEPSIIKHAPQRSHSRKDDIGQSRLTQVDSLRFEHTSNLSNFEMATLAGGFSFVEGCERFFKKNDRRSERIILWHQIHNINIII